MNEIAIPKKLKPIVDAFFAESPKAAKALILQAAKAIYGSDEEKEEYDLLGKSHHVTDQELENICAFMQGLKPADTLEAILASQIVVSHMLGMRKLASGYHGNQVLGLKMLQFSTEAMNMLQKKRSGGMQNITVNYNHNGQGNALMQTILPSEGGLCQ